MTRRVFGAVAGTVVGLVLLLGAKSGSSPTHATVALGTPAGGATPSAPPADGSTGSSGSTGASGSTGSTAAPTPSASATTGATPALRAGTYTGEDVSTQFGDVQVAVTVAGGRVTKVTALTLPSAHFRSQEINSYAAPILRQEALAAQSAQIDVVSGATITSGAYAQSLQAALDAARQ